MTKEYTQQESMQCVGVLQLRHTFLTAAFAGRS